MAKFSQLNPSSQDRIAQHMERVIDRKQAHADFWFRRFVGTLTIGNAGGLIAVVGYLGATAGTDASVFIAVRVPIICFSAGLVAAALQTGLLLFDSILDTKTTDSSALRVIKDEVEYPAGFVKANPYTSAFKFFFWLLAGVSAGTFLVGLSLSYTVLVDLYGIPT